MRLATACRFAILAAIAAALSMHPTTARAQSLFNNRASAGPGQTSATSTTGSLFGNIGFPQPANANTMQGAGGSFVGRSNRGFVGSRASSQSSSSGGESGNADRRSTGSRSVSAERGDSLASARSSPPSADGQREASTGVRRTRIIPRHRIAFEFPARPATAITSQLTKQLANLAARDTDFAQIRVLAEPSGMVKLQGHVPSDDVRKLAAIIVGLEPGVRTVQNELTVRSL